MHKRRLQTAPGFENEVIASMRALPLAPRQNAVVSYEALREAPPPLHLRIGLLDDRYEVFALEIVQSQRQRFIVSYDWSAADAVWIMLHGVIATGDLETSCRRLVARHRNLLNPIWES